MPDIDLTGDDLWWWMDSGSMHEGCHYLRSSEVKLIH